MKIILFMTPILLIVIAIGCSKEHNAPTFAKYAVASKPPTDVVATYDPATKSVNVIWDMSDIIGVIDYYVSISDSSDFDFGNVLVRATNSLDRSYSFNVEKYIPEGTVSSILYFTVSAVYDFDYNNDGIINNNDLNFFIGPRADNPDSTLVTIE